jgi:hypothetical protein
MMPYMGQIHDTKLCMDTNPVRLTSLGYLVWDGIATIHVTLEGKEAKIKSKVIMDMRGEMQSVFQ